MLKRLPLDVSTFSEIISGSYLYVDKTKEIYHLITEGRLYFLARPRRFGKSLLMSTLSEIFSGNRRLFKGLWIDTSDYDWATYPVIYLDFSKLAIATPDQFEKSLVHLLKKIAEGLDVKIVSDSTQGAIDELVTGLSAKNKVVILIDEYDFPIINNIHRLEVAESNREIIKYFFSAIKSLDAHLRAIFITGITRFAKTSMFCGMNNLHDVTFSKKAATLLGCTQQELEQYFADYLDMYATKKSINVDEVKNQVKEWYNGYRFSDESENTVYNLFSLLYFFTNESFKNYWFASGTPTFLVTLLKRNPEKLKSFETVIIGPESIGSFDIETLPINTVLYQTGYLTIGTYEPESEQYTLVFPNHEVRFSFKKYLLVAFLNSTINDIESLGIQLVNALKKSDIDLFCMTLQLLFAHVPYQLHIAQESYYHSLLQLTCTLLGFIATSEVSTDKGRMDMVLETKTHIYIFELKLNDTAEHALQQIIERKYFEKYSHTNKQIILVGLALARKNKKSPLILTWKQKIFTS